jgi:molecular chaperone GrpE
MESDELVDQTDNERVDGEEATSTPATGNAADGRAAQLQSELGDLQDRYLRAVAEMDNVRKRARAEAEDARRYANERLLSELIPVLDNFTRALEAAEQSQDFEALKSGVSLIHRQLTEVLTRAGLQRIEALGQPFDPNQHEAIMQVEPGEGQEPNQVIEELRAGYKLSDRVVRPSLVKVTAA